jgi:hypothetical protein
MATGIWGIAVRHSNGGLAICPKPNGSFARIKARRRRVIASPHPAELPQRPQGKWAPSRSIGEATGATTNVRIADHPCKSTKRAVDMLWTSIPWHRRDLAASFPYRCRCYHASRRDRSRGTPPPATSA